MRKILFLFVLSGLVGAALSAWSIYLVSGLVRGYQMSGPSGLAALVLGFVGGLGAPYVWSWLGVGFRKFDCNAKDSESSRWIYLICVLAPILGLMQGTVVYLMGYFASKPNESLIVSVLYVLASILVAEAMGVLGRGFNWLMDCVTRSPQGVEP